jgi:hypothetical protein
MDAVLRWRDHTETSIEVADPPPPKIEQHGHYFRLAKGTKLRDDPSSPRTKNSATTIDSGETICHKMGLGADCPR